MKTKKYDGKLGWYFCRSGRIAGTYHLFYKGGKYFRTITMTEFRHLDRAFRNIEKENRKLEIWCERRAII